MCGINGYLKHSPENLGAVEEMNQRLYHRGPDYAGIFEDSHIALGHQLLAIRDNIEQSKQPYLEESSPWILLFNGQIYNTEQLKLELGETYRNVDLDTAVLYGMIEKYGWDFITRIHGMFAIALYNKKEKIVRLYRDPSGQKPLYYYTKGNQCIFSSEIKGILAHESVDKELDHDAIFIASLLGTIPGTKTLFKYISKLNASETLTCDVTTGKLTTSFFKSDVPVDYYSGSTQHVFDQLTKEHLQSKRKVAINLSGGLDSSLLLHEMSRVTDSVHSYTTRFDIDDEKFNRDADLAKRLAKDYGTNHTEILISKKDYMENFIESYRAIEEPDQEISTPIYYITAKREGISGDKNRVIISGDGGDELFGGYLRYFRNVRDDTLMRRYTPFVFNSIRNFRNKTPSLDFRNPADRMFFYRYFKYATESYVLKKQNLGMIPTYMRTVCMPFIDLYSQQDNSIYKAMMMDRILWLAGKSLIRSDKIFMSQSAEVRSPLSYHPLRIHFDKTLDGSEYIHERDNKIFLRKFLADKLPQYITHRKDKTGWRGPANIWYDKEMKRQFMEIVSEAKSNSSGVIDWKRVEKSVEKTDSWPGRQIQLLISFAILSDEFGLRL